MTYKEILEKFREDFPEAKVKDYRPTDPVFTKGHAGITVWLDDAMVSYFPNLDKPSDKTSNCTGKDISDFWVSIYVALMLETARKKLEEDK